MGDAIKKETGKSPHIVICNLKRSRMDANRAMDEATFGVTQIELQYKQFHDYIKQAIQAIGEFFEGFDYV